MTYNEYHKVFTIKSAQYDYHTCRRALIDCHDTLDLWGQNIAEDYATRLWAEIDALRERQAKVKA
jgi:hypothetical protein